MAELAGEVSVGGRMKALEWLVRPRVSRADLWLLCTGLLVCLLAQPAINMTGSQQHDATVFAYAGKLVLEGLVPFRDFWDNKPPGIFWTEALAFRLFGGTWVSAMLFQTLSYLLSVGLLWALALRSWPKSLAARAWFLFFAQLLYLHPKHAEGSNLTETYQLVPVLLCVLALSPLGKTTRPVHWLLAGICAASAVLYKPNSAALGLLALAILGTNGESRRSNVQRLLAFTLGGAGTLGLVTLYFARHGVAGEFWFATLGYNLGAYTHQVQAPAFFSIERWLVLEKTHGFSSLLLMGLVALGLLWKEKEAKKRHLVVGAWLLGEVLMSGLTGRTYGHYLVPLAIPVAMWSATLFDLTTRQAHPKWTRRLTVVCLLVVGLQWHSVPKRFGTHFQNGLWDLSRSSQNVDWRIAEIIRERRTRGSERVLTYGHRHGHMMRAGGKPAVPLLSSTHLHSEYGLGRWGPDYLEALEKDSTVLAVVSYRELRSPGQAPYTGTAPRERFLNEMQRLLSEHYELVFEESDRRVFARKTQ